MPIGAVAIALVLLSLLRAFVVRPTGTTDRCPVCSYNLTGNTSGVCPECGIAIRII